MRDESILYKGQTSLQILFSCLFIVYNNYYCFDNDNYTEWNTYLSAHYITTVYILGYIDNAYTHTHTCTHPLWPVNHTTPKLQYNMQTDLHANTMTTWPIPEVIIRFGLIGVRPSLSGPHRTDSVEVYLLTRKVQILFTRHTLDCSLDWHKAAWLRPTTVQRLRPTTVR